MNRERSEVLQASRTLWLGRLEDISMSNIAKRAAFFASVSLLLSCGGGVSVTTGTSEISCAIPAVGQTVDTSKATTVVGTGSPANCTFAQLNSAIATGGIITFNCGANPVTIQVNATLNIPTDRDTVIDGGQKVTLDGQNLVRIMSFATPDFQANEHRLTLQRITLVKGKATPTDAIAFVAPPTLCSQGWYDGEGGALYMRDGNLTVIDSAFIDNHAAIKGPDTGGGAIYVVGSKHGVVIVGSTFTNNSASNAGAVGGLFADLRIYNSQFSQNSAVGNGANDNKPALCSVVNKTGQNQVGSGGNGGAIYSDGQSVNVLLCGDKVTGNSAGDNADGGGLFFTSNNWQGTLSIIDTEMTGNAGGHWTSVKTGSTTNAGTAVGTNCKSLFIKNSILQGLP